MESDNRIIKWKSFSIHNTASTYGSLFLKIRWIKPLSKT